MGSTETRDELAQLNRNFEIYKDKVQELEDVCESYKLVSFRLADENEKLKLLIAKIRHYSTDEPRFDKVKTLVAGLNL